MKKYLLRGVVGGLSRVAPSPMAGWVDRNMLSTRRREQPLWERELLRTAESFTFLSGGRELAGWIWTGERIAVADAERPVVVLMHGWEGRGAQLASFAAPLVEAGFDVATFDAPGHGLSPGKSSSFPEMRAGLEDLARHLESRRLGRPHAVVAHSAGTVSAAWAVRAGLAVDRLVFIAPPADPVAEIDRYGTSVGLTAEVLRRTRRRIEQRFQMSWEELRSVIWAPEMRQELFVVHDRGDRWVRYSEGEALAAAWPGARLLATEGKGHHRVLRDPEVIDETVRFLLAEARS